MLAVGARRRHDAAMTREELATAGYELSEAEHDRLAAFVRLLLEHNAQLNLTAATSADAFWRAHVCDALALLSFVGDTSAARVTRLIDVGSGNGVPGLVLACVAPQFEVTLLDARKKKLLVLEAIARELGLSAVQTVWARAEDAARHAQHREQSDVATARAVGGLRTVLELTSGFVRPGGRVWLFRSVHDLEAEIEQAQRAAGRCRLSLQTTQGYALPPPHGDRVLLNYEKDRPLPAGLPRSAGRPKTNPI